MQPLIPNPWEIVQQVLNIMMGAAGKKEKELQGATSQDRGQNWLQNSEGPMNHTRTET
jgi:hypothetical protein